MVCNTKTIENLHGNKTLQRRSNSNICKNLYLAYYMVNQNQLQGHSTGSCRTKRVFKHQLQGNSTVDIKSRNSYGIIIFNNQRNMSLLVFWLQFQLLPFMNWKLTQPCASVQRGHILQMSFRKILCFERRIYVGSVVAQMTTTHQSRVFITSSAWILDKNCQILLFWNPEIWADWELVYLYVMPKNF